MASALTAVQPANASSLLRDLGLGAGTNVVTGLVLKNGSVVSNAGSGAATDAAIRATQGHPHRRTSGLLQNAAVGAATNTVVGAVLGNGHVGNNALSGAADGLLYNLVR